MGRAKILFFTCEPGGAEALIPVIGFVQQQDRFAVDVAGYGAGLDRFTRKGVACDAVRPVGKLDFELVDRYEPDILITSATSLPSVDMSEKYLWLQARQRGIPSLAFLDQWQNYVLRFSGREDGERLAYLPDYINCIDQTAVAEMVAEGFDPERLIPMGQPYLSSLSKNDIRGNVAIVRERLVLRPSDQVVLFVSEAIKEHFGRERGYDQYDAADLLIRHLKQSSPDCVLLIKLHPKDRKDSYKRLVQACDLDVRIVADGMAAWESLGVADEVYGMSSMMLIEAFLLGLPVASIQPGLLGEDPFLLTRIGILKRIGSMADFPGFDRLPGRREMDISFDEARFLGMLEMMLRQRAAL